MSVVKYPGKHDVMLGRGGESNYHSGNIAFRHMVQGYKEQFRLGSRKEKNRVVEDVVHAWRNQVPPGRFLAKRKANTGEALWQDVGDELARKRAAKSLAEWTPSSSFQKQKQKQQALSDAIPSTAKRTLSESSSPVNCHIGSNDSIGERRLPEPQQQFSEQDQYQLYCQEEQQRPNKRRNVHEPLPSLSNPSVNVSEVAMMQPQQHISPSLGGNDHAVGEYIVCIQNQLCNLSDIDVIPVTKVQSFRLHLPTAAELSATAFSDEDNECKPAASPSLAAAAHATNWSSGSRSSRERFHNSNGIAWKETGTGGYDDTNQTALFSKQNPFTRFLGDFRSEDWLR